MGRGPLWPKNLDQFLSLVLKDVQEKLFGEIKLNNLIKPLVNLYL